MEFHPHEIRVLKGLAEDQKETWYTPASIETLSGLNVDAISRAVSWLTTKGLVEASSEVRQEISLDKEGVDYRKSGLPERRLIKKIGKGCSIEELKEKSDPQL